MILGLNNFWPISRTAYNVTLLRDSQITVLLLCRDDPVPADSPAQEPERRIRDYWRQETQFLPRELIDFQFDIREHGKEVARLLTAVDLNQRSRIVFTVLNKPAHDLL